jgi:hypothetical protein
LKPDRRDFPAILEVGFGVHVARGVEDVVKY